MGIMKEPASLQEEDTENLSSVEDELLSGRGKPGPGPAPLAGYIDMHYRALAKKLPRNINQGVLVLVGLAALLACTAAAASALRSSQKPDMSLRTPGNEMEAKRKSLVSQEPVPDRTVPSSATASEMECDFKKQVFCAARTLLRNPEVHRVVTDNLMRTNNKLITQGDYEMVKEFAWMGFKKINQELGERAPQVAAEVDRIQLNAAQKNAALDLLALLSDPGVESIGFDVAKIIRASKFTTKRFLKFYIEDSLQPVDEIQKVAHEMIPKSVQQLWDQGGHDWELTLNERNIRTIRANHVTRHPNMTGVDYETKSLAIYAGVLEQGRVLLDILKMHIRSLGPAWTTDLRDSIDLLFEGIALPTDRNKLEFAEVFLWPLKCGAQGLDALRASVSQEYGHELAG